ncbi:non-ribosomal peptide synthetase [Musicola paradisiaca]|uniref:AMP-dependent synthetase and ligase n=1 Tax=Musicola paradisiaca (strain Ech703) TaxID=579405 RepID=C6CCJ6_MUSP7|nr:non-ribosomal peptide synthetase [Musicola paradisiaca]ACS86839.1 AMP-dependent synthetase and ligase [Musicola paradisiaca Ech703]
MINLTEPSLDKLGDSATLTAFGFEPRSLPDLIRYQARWHPQRLALMSEEGELTFAQLDEHSNRLAQALAEQGVGYGHRVALQGEKSLMFVLLQLAVLKLGAAFIPLASGLPALRRAKMLADASPCALIIEDGLTRAGESVAGTMLLTWSEVENRSSRLPAVDPDIPLLEQDIAWVFYTSGSTGTPKGVLGTHGASLKRCGAMATLQPISSQEVIAHVMPDTAIDAIWEVWAPLGFGLPVVLIDVQRYTDLEQVVALLARHQVTQICIVPAYLTLLLNSGLPLGNMLPSLNIWISTGERASRALVDLFFHHLPAAQLLNQYGLTETLATATCFTMTTAQQGEGRVAIGTEIDHIQAWVLDAHFHPLGENAVGQLCMGGEALALGYLASPALTADRFRPNPFATDGSRLYLSGDLASRDKNGQLHYHGREDRRVNVLGHRIELGDIEAAIEAIPEVAQAAVVYREHNDQTEIYGFYVASDALTLRQVINHLNERLPCYMVPIQLFPLSALPTLPGGKTDYRALSAKIALDQVTTDCDSNSVEQRLLTIVGQLLDTDIPNLNVNFFDYGGNSIIAIRLINEVRRHLHVIIENAEIYNAETLSALAQTIRRKQFFQEAS